MNCAKLRQVTAFIVCFAAVMSHAALTIDWTNTAATKIGTNFTLNLSVDSQGSYGLVSTVNVPAAMQFSVSGSTSLPEMSNSTFSLTFSSVNGQNFESHSSAGAYRVGMQGGDNIWRFDQASEVARISADLSDVSSLVRLRLASYEALNSVSDYVIGLRDSTGTETLGATNQTDLSSIAPLLPGGTNDWFDFRATVGSAGGWGSLTFEFTVAEDVEVVQLAKLFSSGCVLQCEQTVPVWGTCAPNDTITVTVHNQTKQTVSDADGNWRVELDSEAAGGPYALTVSGSSSLPSVLSNVYFGDVWILTGQSNMFQPLGAQVAAFPNDYPSVPDETDDFDDVRLMIIDPVPVTNAPAEDVVVYQAWSRWEADRLADMSTVGYFFTKALNAALDADGQSVPIGIIKVCKGGTAIEEWIDADTLSAAQTADPSLLLDAEASRYYNGMIAAIQDYPIKGALWYQGEANTQSSERIGQYAQLMDLLISSWREQWNNQDLPFYYEQLAPHHRYAHVPRDELWAWMREAQTSCLSISNTAMGCVIDGGLQGNIHPPFKDRVGERLARVALAHTYGMDVVSRGPVVTNVQFSGSDVILTFDHVADGLQPQAVDSEPDAEELAAGYPAVSVSSNELAGFALCGSDQVFYWVDDAEVISSNQVRVSNVAEVPEPVAVRYAWQDYPRCNLFSSEGLPAEPFRSDTYAYGTSSGGYSEAPEFSAIYQDDFSGVQSADATDTVPEVSLSGFSDVANGTGLDGEGRLESTLPTAAGANYRFQIAELPLTENPSIGAVKCTMTLRTPTNDWVMIGFHENNVNGIFSEAANAGPVLQFGPTYVVLRSGDYTDGTNVSIGSAFVPGEVITAEMTYHLVSQTMDLSINGEVVTNGFAVEHEFPTGTNSNPVILWAQVQLRRQPSAADGGTYIDSLLIETNAAAQGTVIYQDDFSGETGAATTTVAEVASAGFEHNYLLAGLDGNGRLESTDPTSSSAGYRVKLGAAPLTEDASIAAVYLKMKLRIPTNDWVMVGFQEQDAAALLNAARNSGPMVQFSPTYAILRGGTWGGGSVSESILEAYVPGQVVVVEMLYHIAEQTLDLSIDGMMFKEGFLLGHEYPVGTNSDPVVYWLNTQFRFQPSAMNGGSYIDSWEVRTVPTAYACWAAARQDVIGTAADDFDEDGLSNLYEYGLNGDPADAQDRGGLSSFSFEGDRLIYIYPRLATLGSGLRYRLETCTNLIDGAWSDAGYTVMETNVAGNVLNYVTNEVDVSGRCGFVRLVIEQ